MRYIFEFLSHFLRLFVVMLFSVLGASMAFAVPMGTSGIIYSQTETTHFTPADDLAFAARALPMAVTNVTITGGVTVMQGSAFALNGQETVAALSGFDGDFNATNRGFASADEAFDAIGDVRSTRTITDVNGGTGTVSITDVNGQRYVGVNSTNFTDADRALARQWEAELGIPAGPAGNFQRQTLYHAEANTLMKIYDDTGGQMPSNLTIYVDRIACSSCQNNLPNLIENMGVENLTIKLPDGRSAVVTKGGFVRDWQ